MQMNVGMTSKEFLHLRGFVRGEIIGDEVDFFTLGLMGHEVREKPQIPPRCGAERFCPGHRPCGC